MTFLTVKAFHLVAMVAWFAAMFYLPRLFVYHCSASTTEAKTMLATMERKLYRGIMTPAALVTLGLGAWLTILNWSAYADAIWFWIKLACVLALFAFHGMCGGMVRKFQTDSNTRSEGFYRLFNEIPLVFLVAIVLLAVFKPSF